jgi:hypothetical protein
MKYLGIYLNGLTILSCYVYFTNGFFGSSLGLSGLGLGGGSSIIIVEDAKGIVEDAWIIYIWRFINFDVLKMM